MLIDEVLMATRHGHLRSIAAAEPLATGIRVRVPESILLNDLH